MDITNPPTELWTGAWEALTFDNKPTTTYDDRTNDIDDTGYTRVIDGLPNYNDNGNAEGRTWVGESVKAPNLFRVVRNLESYEERRAKQNEYAEVHIRLIPKINLLATQADGSYSAWIEVWMPVEYDIPNGGTKICELGHNYHTDLDGQYCEITADRKIILYTSVAGDTVDENGVLSSSCSNMRVTTEGAIGGDGIKLSEDPGTNSFEVYEYVNNQLKEYSVPSVLAQPESMSFISCWAPVTESTSWTSYRCDFITNYDIPAGYDTSTNEADSLNSNPVGYIKFEFNTRDCYICDENGYEWNLGIDILGDGTFVPCLAASGIQAKSGEELNCQVQYATTNSWFDPVVVTISNFQAIATDTYVSIHFMKMRTLRNWNNEGLIQVSSYQIAGDSSKTNLIEKTDVTVQNSKKDTIDVKWIDLPATTNIDVTPATKYVGEQLIMKFSFEQPEAMEGNTKDHYVFEFPFEFELKYLNNSNIIGTIPNYDDDDAAVVQLETEIYADMRNLVNIIYFRIPYGETIASKISENNVLTISQIRSPCHQYTETKSIELTLTRNLKRLREYRFTDYPAPNIAPFSSQVMLLSSYTAGAVYVTYTFQITPTYRIPANSKITITLPNYVSSQYQDLNYTFFPHSSPSAVLTATPSGSIDITGNGNPTYGIQENQIQVLVTNEIAESQPISLTVTGTRNPDYIGLTPSGPTDYLCEIKVYDDNSMSWLGINSGNFDPVTFLEKKTSDVLYMMINSSSVYSTVESDYTFTLQTTNDLPEGGYIYLLLPPEWKDTITRTSNIISELTGSFSTDTLSYTESYDATTGILTIKSDFEWPGKSSLYISIDDLVNPDVRETSQFGAYTQYDGKEIDVTDSEDTSLTLSFNEYSPSIDIKSFSLSPSNQGETSTLSLSLSSSNKTIPKGTEFEFSFSEGYDTLLTTYDKEITCSSPNMTNVTCIIENGILKVSLDFELAPGEELELSIDGIANPNEGSYSVDITTRYEDEILDYTSSAITMETTEAPEILNFTYLATTSTNLQTKSNYTFCVQVSDPIPLNAAVLIEFPSQFSMKSSQYECNQTEDNTALEYADNSTSPLCSINNGLRQLNITGHINSYNGGVSKSLCYITYNIENPADSGESGNFIISIQDIDNKKILYKTYGTLSYPTTISYSREGLIITVANVPDIAVGQMSNEIDVTLERSVPYTVYLTPNCEGFEFIPTTIEFLSYLGKTQTFKISPLDNATLGSNKITWTKVEDTNSTRFSEVADTYFNLVENPGYKEQKVAINPSISRTALKSTSLPVTVTLSHPAAKTLILYYSTIKPKQESYITFNPPYLVFEPGETTKTFTYDTLLGAVSGVISFSLDENYADKYYMSTTSMNFEILDVDYDAPTLINYYVVNMERCYMYFRISTSESVWVYYLLTLKGTRLPPTNELKNYTKRILNENVTDVVEKVGSNSSYQAEVTKTYIYYDTYIMLEGLEEQTDYVLFYFVEDLSGNSVSTVEYPFTTSKKHYPARFKIVMNDDVDTDELVSAFGLITGLQSSRFIVNSARKKFTIDSAQEEIIKTLLEKQQTAYDFTLIPNKTSCEITPIQLVNEINKQMSILYSNVPEVDSTYDLNLHAYSITDYPQEFSYTPIQVATTMESVKFNVSIERNGSFFAVVQLAGETTLNARQVKYGLNSINFYVESGHYVNGTLEYSEDFSKELKMSMIVEFTNLYDNTEYEAYFAAENNLPHNPDLMLDKNIIKLTFVTQKEIFVIPDDYITFSMQLPNRIMMFIYLLLFLLLIID